MNQRQETTIETVPVAEEDIVVGKETKVAESVKVEIKVHQDVKAINEMLMAEEIEVRRVAVNQVIDAPAKVRTEGETTVIPIMKEELIVTKQLILVEELHVTKRRAAQPDNRTVSVRREEAVVSRTAGNG